MNTACIPLIWNGECLELLDQRLLPTQELFIRCSTIEEAHAGIRDMVVRGAPCIGFTAVFGLGLWLRGQVTFRHEGFRHAAQFMKTARPTAVNLMYEVDRVSAEVLTRFPDGASAGQVAEYVVQDGQRQLAEAGEKNLSMARTALLELEGLYGTRPLNLMTHCNTGVLACGVLGTALGVISHAHSLGRVGMVYADETRPYMQGSRLTAFELDRESIPYHLVVEGAASWLLSNGKVDAIFVGADRIAANGDTANKVGTATLAIVAKHYGVPFYVVAPLSSFDFTLFDGKGIEIELRHEDEILGYKSHRFAPAGARALNPSFDVTPASLITGIICEKGIVRSPNKERMGVLRGES